MIRIINVGAIELSVVEQFELTDMLQELERQGLVIEPHLRLDVNGDVNLMSLRDPQVGEITRETLLTFNCNSVDDIHDQLSYWANEQAKEIA